MPDLPEVTQDFTADVSAYIAALSRATAAARAFAQANRDIGKLSVDAGNATAGIRELAAARLDDAAATNEEIRAGLEQARTLQLIDNAVGRAATDMTMLSINTSEAGNALVRAGTDGRNAWLPLITGGGGGIFGFLTKQIALFGGAGILGLFKSISVWHLMADAILEVAAVLIPAGIALGAWAIAAGPTIGAVKDRMVAVWEASKALGQSIPPLTSSFQNVVKAVQPTVWSLLGAAISLASSHMHDLQIFAVGAGHALDAIAARATLALAGGGLSSFLKNAVSDLQRLLTVFGNVFGIIGNILKMLPGYAQVFLMALVGITHVLEVITGSPAVQWFGKLALALHGAIIWGGLVGTALVALRGPLLAMAQWAVGAAWAIQHLADVFKFAAQEGGFFAGLEAVFAENPFMWTAVAIAGLVALLVVIEHLQAPSEAWVNTLQHTIDVQTTLPGVINATSFALQKANQAQASLHASGVLAAKAMSDMGSVAAQKAGPGLTALGEKASAAAQGQFQFGQEMLIENQRLNELAQKFGGAQLAVGLFAAAGIKAGDVAHANSQQWAQDVQQVNQMYLGWKAMGIQAGTLGNAVNALTFQTELQDSKVQTLTQAWQTFLGVVTGGQTALIGFEQQIAGTKQIAQGLGVSLAVTNGRVSETSSTARSATTPVMKLAASMSGLSANSLQLRAAFEQSITSAGQLASALQTNVAVAGMGARGTAMFTQAIKDMVAQLLPLTGNSKQAVSQVSALAQLAGGPATTSMQALAKWTGNEGAAKAAADLNKITGTLTVSVSNLITDVGNLGAAMNQVFQQGMAQGLISTGQVAAATRNLTNDLNSQHTSMNQTHTDLRTFYNDALLATGSTNRAKAALGALIITEANHRAAMQGVHVGSRTWIDDMITIATKLGLSKTATYDLISAEAKIPKNVFDNIWVKMHGTASGTVNVATATIATAGPKAAGGYISGPGTGTSDSIPAYLSNGEYVMKAAAVSKYGTHMMNMINAQHFAVGGGVTKDGNVGAIDDPRQQWQGWRSQFEKNMEGSLVSGMRTSLLNGMRQAVAMARQAFLDTGARSGNAALAQSFAASILPRGWSFGDLLALWNRESGWNAYAVNPSSGAYGIPQSLGHGHPYALGDYKAQIMWGLNYIAGRYGNSQAAWAHEVAFGWYDQGGHLPPGLSLAYNGTGRPEPVGTGGHGDIHVSVQLNGRELLRAIAQEQYKYDHRNSGVARFLKPT